jgi:hypothetical protein
MQVPEAGHHGAHRQAEGRLRWREPDGSRGGVETGANRLQKSSISQNIGISCARSTDYLALIWHQEQLRGYAMRHTPLFFLAGPTRLELATSGVTGRRSNQLNYDPDMECIGGTGLEPAASGL